MIIHGREYAIRKIHPSPNTEGEMEQGRGMKCGNEPVIFHTGYGQVRDIDLPRLPGRSTTRVNTCSTMPRNCSERNRLIVQKSGLLFPDNHIKWIFSRRAFAIMRDE